MTNEKQKNTNNPESENKLENTDESSKNNDQEKKVIDESNYKFGAPKPKGPTAIGSGGDPFFRRIYVPNEQINDLLEKTITVQDWVQRETSNNVALTCLNNENLKDIYFQMKDGFGEYGPILLMGFKTPQGVEIPRLKVLDTNGEVISILTGPSAIDELNKRALAYREINTDITI